MTLTCVSAAVAGGCFVLFMLVSALTAGRRWRHGWVLPAGLSVAFFTFSVVTVVVEGLVGFWELHTANLLGNQVWFDLLLAAGVGWSLLLPQAKAAGMRPLPWLVLVVLTGSVGLLAVLARLSYLEQQRNARHLSNEESINK
jgi:hypothetical protein